MAPHHAARPNKSSHRTTTKSSHHTTPAKPGVTMKRVLDAVNSGLAFVQDACRTSTLKTAKSVASQIEEVALKIGARCPEAHPHELVTVALNEDHVAALDAARIDNPVMYAALRVAAMKAHKKMAGLKPAQVRAYYEKAGAQLLRR